MDFEFSSEQELLRQQVRGFLDANCAPRVVRGALDGDARCVGALWRDLVALGWTATVVPERFGGLGLSYIELSVIAEELGRACAPVPFSSSVYLATEALLLAGSEAQQAFWLSRLATGEIVGTFAMAEGNGGISPETMTTVVAAGRMTGSKLPVPDAGIARFAVVLARYAGGDGGALYLVDIAQDGVSVTSAPTLDPTRTHGVLGFRAAECEPLGAPGEGWGLMQRLMDRAAVLFAWEQVGGSQAALEQAREYALSRYAFGRPIGSFQAIKHKLATMYVNNVLARSNCYFGAWALAQDAPELPLAAATARVSAIQAYHFASKENIHTHGGMGFTWESDCQFHYRRARLLAVNIGNEALWKDRLITAVERRGESRRGLC